MGVEEFTVAANGVRLNVATAGTGPAVVLLHGFPHTWRIWSAVIPDLADRHRVIAPDLRGLGASERADSGYDAATLADDVLALLDGVGESRASVVALDAGVPPAFLLAARHPQRITRLVLMEALIGVLPGAEDFLAGGPPWWFGFHAVPGLAESVLAGNERAYIDFFLRQGTADGAGPPPPIREAILDAYADTESLRCAFEYYRAGTRNAADIADAARSRLTVPTMTIGAGVVGEATHRQLRPITDDLVGHVIADSGHIVPVDAPGELLESIGPFLTGG
ncbi:alpha/beta fold hydrolase [Gordonia soli]|uniref:Putative hydrolase n=1 Tax=Gordonia soli NBRC 108243 TaxID=1223545 RepID=M0QJE7_9ACTN|nr:alpha/beta hydrolase [Gordonia soli]GAC68381.1 putative hydrolase [Gordonia soli NBRC 108243]